MEDRSLLDWTSGPYIELTVRADVTIHGRAVHEVAP